MPKPFEVTFRVVHDLSPEVLEVLRSISLPSGAIMAALDALKTEVEESKTVTESAIALLNGLKAKLDEAIASNDPAKLQELASQLDSQSNELARVVAANTVAEDEESPPVA